MGTSKAIGPGLRIAAWYRPLRADDRPARGRLIPRAADVSPGHRDSLGPFRSGLTRIDGAGTGSRARPESECDLRPMIKDRIRPIPRTYIQKHTTREHPVTDRTSRAGQANGPGADPRAVWVTRLLCGSEVHVAATAGHGGGLLLLRLLHDHGLSSEEQARDRRRVLQRRPGDLRGVDDPGLEHVDILTGRGVQALPSGQRLDLLDHHATLEAGVHRDLLQRLLQRPAHDLRAGRLVADQVELLEGTPARLQQRDAATGHDTFLDRGLGVAHRVLDAVLALLQFDLGSRARLDDGDAAGQLGQPLLQLLPVVVGVGVVDLGADLVNPAGDLVRVARAVDDRRLVLGDHDLAGPAEH